MNRTFTCLLVMLVSISLSSLSYASQTRSGSGASNYDCGGAPLSDSQRNCYINPGEKKTFEVYSDDGCGRYAEIQVSGACSPTGTWTAGNHTTCVNTRKVTREVTFTGASENQNCTIRLTAEKHANKPVWTETWQLKKAQIVSNVTDLPSPLVYGTTFQVQASNNNAEVPVDIMATGSCDGQGQNSATIYVNSGMGTCTVTYSTAATYKYNAAPTITRTQTVTKADQILEVQSPSDEAEFSPADIVSAQAIAYTGGLQHGVFIEASGEACDVSGDSTLAISASGLGECIIRYSSKADSNNYESTNASAERKIFFVTSPQVIDVTQYPPANGAYAYDEFTVAATADSGEPVTIEVSGDGCVPATGESSLTIQTLAAGDECFIRYTRDEVLPEFEAADPVEQWVTIIKQQQAIIVDQVSHAEPNSLINISAELLHSKMDGGADISITTNSGCTINSQSNNADGSIDAQLQLANSGFCSVQYNTPETDKFEQAPTAEGRTKIVVKNNEADVSGIWGAGVLVYAKDDQDNIQPITSAPMVSRSKKITGTYPNTIVMFGTGQYMYDEDLTDQKMQSLYVVHDRGTTDIVRNAKVPDSEEDLDMLQKREFSYHLLDGEVHRRVKGDKGNTEDEFGQALDADPLDWSEQYGWYVNLDAANLIAGEGSERSVFRPIVVGDVLMLSTLIPQLEMSCASETKGVFVSMDWTSGFASKSPSYDVNDDGVLDSTDLGFVGSLSSSLSQLSYFNEHVLFTKDNEVVVSKVDPSSSSSGGGFRVGWEERRVHGSITE